MALARRRHGDDRRPVRSIRRAEPARPRDAGGERRRDPLAARALPRLQPAAGDRGAVLVNNLDWLGEIGLIDWLRDVGKHFTIPYMLAKDSVTTRMDRGLSFTEFSYMLIQATDYEHLHRTMGVDLQMGGADQWGNITAGLELIRRRAGLAEDDGDRGADEPAHAPGLQAAAVAVGREVRQDRGRDLGLAGCRADVAVRVLPVLAEHGRPRRRHVPAVVHAARPRRDRGARGARWRRRPEARAAQRALAADITERTHGAEAPDARRARERSGVLRRADPRPSVLATLHEAVGGFAFTDADRSLAGALADRGSPSGLYASAGEARRAIAQGGLTINDERVDRDRRRRPDPRSTGSGWSSGREAPAGGRAANAAGSARVAAAEDVDHRRRGDAPLGEQHEGVVEESAASPASASRVAPRRRRGASAAASSLAAIRTSVASSVTFRPTASTPPSSRLVV